MSKLPRWSSDRLHCREESRYGDLVFASVANLGRYAASATRRDDVTAFNERTWRFPVDSLRVDSAVLCVVREGDSGPAYCEGGRVDFFPIELPDIDYSYEKTTPEELSVMFWLPRFRFDGLDSLAGRTIIPTEEEQTESDGSVYAFSAHNPVDTLEARFGEPLDGSIPVELTLRFDFEHEGRLGGAFVHRFMLLVSVERR
jgi:hypothetical protein